MFDKRIYAVLAYLENQCPAGNYKVIDKCDIVAAMPKRFNISCEILDDIISFLTQREFLVLKYNDDEQVCVSLTAKGHSVLIERTKSIERPKFDNKIYYIVAVVAFLGALLGTVVGKFLGF